LKTLSKKQRTQFKKNKARKMILDDIFKQFNSYLNNYNDDLVDRFYYVYSVIGMAIYLVFITSKQYYGEVIQCHLGRDLPGETVKYINSM
jgi:hypothetical protein